MKNYSKCPVPVAVCHYYKSRDINIRFDNIRSTASVCLHFISCATGPVLCFEDICIRKISAAELHPFKPIVIGRGSFADQQNKIVKMSHWCHQH